MSATNRPRGLPRERFLSDDARLWLSSIAAGVLFFIFLMAAAVIYIEMPDQMPPLSGWHIALINR